MAFKRSSPLPGFGLTFGYTVTYLALLVLIPMGALSLRVATHMTWAEFWKLATADIAVATYRLTFGASLADALVDFPFALPTAVAGLTLADLFSGNGWLGRFLMPLGIKVAYTWLGIVVALTFVGLPFVVRTLQPVLENLDRETEEAAATLGAGRLRTFFSVIVPTLTPALLTGFALSFARAIGEYGSVIFISSNKVFEGQITPLLIVHRLEEYDYTGAMALAVVMLVFSFTLLIGINALERWASRFQE